MNKKDDIEITAAGNENPYHQHLEHCDQCRHDPFHGCTDGDRALRQAVSDGSPLEADRMLDKIRNGSRDD